MVKLLWKSYKLQHKKYANSFLNSVILTSFTKPFYFMYASRNLAICIMNGRIIRITKALE